MKGPYRHDGPLAPCVSGYRDWLLGRGYTPSATVKALIALGHLGRWRSTKGSGLINSTTLRCAGSSALRSGFVDGCRWRA